MAGRDFAAFGAALGAQITQTAAQPWLSFHTSPRRLGTDWG
jgi:hypothetical protein